MEKRYYFESDINRFSTSDAELNYQKTPFDEEYNYKLTNKSNPFADCGAWFGYYLPNEDKLAFYGPNVISQEIPLNLAKYVSNTIVKVNGEIQKMSDFYFEEKNGQLLIKSKIENKDFSFDLVKKLLFVNQEDALISLEIKAKSKIDLKIELLNEIYGYKKVKYRSTNDENNSKDWFTYTKNIKFEDKQINFNLDPLIDKKEKEIFQISHSDKIKLISSKKCDDKNAINYLYQFASFELKRDKTLSKKINWYESFYFNSKKHHLDFKQSSIDKLRAKTIKRWKEYIAKFARLNPQEKAVSIKCLYTLIGNWLGPNGQIKSNTIIPSRTYVDFIGAYGWDIFKIAYGLSEFDPELAKDVLNSMFDHQLKKDDSLRPWDHGMIPDAIFYNFSIDRGGIGQNWNERNTKPPLASWSAWKVYKKTNDKTWLKSIYPKLAAFQQWWDRTRRAQSAEYFLSYGATLDYRNDVNDKKTILEAISWESGMDNAPRFDWDRMEIFGNYVDQNLISYVIDQVSICLNSFYYIELISLNKIHVALGKSEDKKLIKIAKELKDNINKFMYSNVDHAYHDIKFNKKKPLVEYGLSIEAFLPLYSKVATKTNANNFIKSLNEENFLTPFPFPTVAKNNERFDPTDYWRGPVWISFLYFAVIGIRNYNKTLAKEIENNILQILNSPSHLKKPLRENYHPLNQEGLSTTNFSWTASMLISMVKEMKK